MTSRANRGPSAVLVTTHDGTRVVVRAFPHDERFVRDVERVLAAASRTGSPAQTALRARLEQGLRPWYPMATVRRREDLAGITEGEETWYAMRDGRVRGPRDRIDRLHAVLADARAISETSTAVIEQARETIARAARSRGPQSVSGAAGSREAVSGGPTRTGVS